MLTLFWMISADKHWKLDSLGPLLLLMFSFNQDITLYINLIILHVCNCTSTIGSNVMLIYELASLNKFARQVQASAEQSRKSISSSDTKYAQWSYESYWMKIGCVAWKVYVPHNVNISKDWRSISLWMALSLLLSFPIYFCAEKKLQNLGSWNLNDETTWNSIVFLTVKFMWGSEAVNLLHPASAHTACCMKMNHITLLNEVLVYTAGFAKKKSKKHLQFPGSV